jgi:hypothetical protein
MAQLLHMPKLEVQCYSYLLHEADRQAAEGFQMYLAVGTAAGHSPGLGCCLVDLANS